MIPNKLKSLWAAGKPTRNGGCSIGNPFPAEIMAAQGFVSVTIDMPHGVRHHYNVSPRSQAMGARGAVLMTREPWNKPGIKLNALDAGAYGIICAMVISKRGAIIINTARGGIVDEVALSEALRQGQIASAGIDVFDAEPPAADHPLLGFDQVILTPHTAGLTREAAERVAVASVQNVLDHFAERLNPALIMNKDF